jgi:lipoate-protein ligase A
VKIRSGVEVKQSVYKAPGGLIRASTEVREGVVANVSFSGDFFFYPEEKLTQLETTLTDIPIEEVEQTIANFYDMHNIQSPGVTPTDFAQAAIQLTG